MLNNEDTGVQVCDYPKNFVKTPPEMPFIKVARSMGENQAVSSDHGQ